jgi:GT2 family glycosyltransferase
MIYCVVPVFNRKHLLRGCLLSLKEQTYKDYKVVVVDDGSTDGTAEMLKDEFPDVKVLRGNGNLWWTGAINKGIDYVLLICNEEDYVLVLNDDLIVPPEYLANFVSLAAAHPDTLIGSVVTDINDRDVIYSGGVRINWITAKMTDLNRGKKLSSFGKGYYTEVSYLTGRGVLIPSKVFREIGLYNNKHYLQCGDIELPARARLAGYKLIVSYDVPVFGYVKAKGHINHLDTFKLRDIKKFFFDIRSNANVRYRFWFAYDTTPNLVQGTIYLIFDLLRVTSYFVRHLVMAKKR